MICPLVCSKRVNHKTIDTPPGYTSPPKKVICPICNQITDTEYRNDVVHCDICFCCICPCGKNDPYLACVECGENMGSVAAYKCNQCSISTTYKSKFCPKCGTTKQ